jgi:two-component system, NarL family, nitrate/nitrite sensor histidine kinase NarX
LAKFKIREKITGLLVFYFFIAITAIGCTLYVSWQLEGAAAAINDAGKERMRTYRIAYLLTQYAQEPSLDQENDIRQELGRFEKTLTELQHGNPQRPLFIPDDPLIQGQMQTLLESWAQDIRPRIEQILRVDVEHERRQLLTEYRPVTEHFVDQIDALVAMVESSNARSTTLLRSIQIALMVVALLGTILLDYIFSLLLVRPVQRLNQGLQSLGQADFSVRLQTSRNDELGQLARGFNQMAEKLQDIYATLEQRVANKTRSLDLKNRELSTLYEVASFLSSSKAAEPLCDNVLDRMIALMNAIGGVVRLTDPKGEKLQIVAARGVSANFLADETFLDIGACICGEVARDGVAVSSDFSVARPSIMMHSCSKENIRAVAAVPIRSRLRVLGTLNLFFDSTRILPPAEVRLLESVGLHLGIAIENQRLVAREREMAVSEERNLLAQELHDSIAQSLAFLNIQVQLLQDDLNHSKVADAMQVLEQIRAGVQESYDDVRELLVHFRTRLEHADLESAIAGTLKKFEGQSSIATEFIRLGPTLEVQPEHVLQILHILQESLSNIRKHAGASLIKVTLDTRGPCSLSVEDDGQGFDNTVPAGDNHVGINIMRERADRFGGHFSIHSAMGTGTRVVLSWSPVPLSTKEHTVT